MTENLTNLNFWIFIALVASQGVILSWMYTKCFDIKIKKPVFCVILTLFTVMPQLPAFLIGGFWLDMKALIYVALEIGLLLITVKKGRVKAIIMLFSVIVVDTVVEILITFLWAGFDPTAMEESANLIFSEIRSELSVLFTLIILPIRYMFVKLWNRIFDRESSDRVNIWIILFPIAQMIVVFCLMIDREFSSLGDELSLSLSMIGYVMLCVSDVLFFFFIGEIERKRKLEAELEIVEFAREIEEKHYLDIEKNIYEMAKIRHDVNNQLTTIKRMISDGNSNAASETIIGLEEQLSATREQTYCSEPVVNAVLAEKNEECSKNDIALEININALFTGNISKNHICSIFTNMLDNAINENMRIDDKERKIIITVNSDEDYLAVRCENPTASKKAKKRSDDKNHGYGLKILADIALQYDGSFETSVKGEMFTSDILVRTK